MALTLPITKFLPPMPRTTLLSRPRLLHLLERRLTDYRSLLVTAPAGYGKTSLLTDFVSTSKYPICWYSLEPADQEFSSFLTHLITAIEQTFPGFSATVPSLLSPDIPADVALAVVQLVNALHAYLQHPFLIVLENFQHIEVNPTVCYFISQFIQKVTDHCHLVIDSRVLPSLPDLPLMAVRHQVGQVTMQELAFQPEEVMALLRQNYELTLPRAEVQSLTQASEGWITGLLLTLVPGVTRREAAGSTSQPLLSLHDYFTQQVLDPQPPWLRERLLWTSLMVDFDASLCHELLGNTAQEGDWNRFVEQSRSQGLFVLVDELRPERIRYHPLFRNFLQARLWQEQPARALQLTGRLAAYYERQGDWTHAHEFYERLGSQALVSYLERVGSVLLRAGELTLLKAWLEALPIELVQLPPLLSLRGAVTVMEGNPKRGLLLLERAVVKSRETGALEVLARALVRSAVAHVFVGDYHRAMADSDEALALVARTAGATALHAEALRSRGLSLVHLGQSHHAQEWLEQALALYETLQEGQNVAILHTDLGMVHINLGRYHTALYHQSCALEYWQQIGNLGWQANLLNNLGVLYLVQGDYLQANQCLEAGLGYAVQSGYTRLEAFVWCSLGDLYEELGAYEAAAHAYMRARQGAGQVSEQFLLLALRVSHARWLRHQGLLTLAHHTLAITYTLVETNGSSLECGLYHREAGFIALAEYHTSGGVQTLEQAQHHLEQALVCFTEGGQQADIPGVQLGLAALYHFKGQSALCHTALTLAFALGSELESSRPLVSAAREVKVFLSEAKSWIALGGYVTHLLQQVETWEDNLPIIRRQIRPHVSSVPFLPPHLTFHALGDEQVWVDGVGITHARWRFLKARDLLFCLLAHPRGLTKEQVGLLFWPDCSPTQLKQNFKVIIHRLRRILGQEVILQEDGVYRFNNALDYESDVEQFKSRLAQAHTAIQPTARLAAYRGAIAYYQGSYLPHLDEEWVLLEREHLRLAYIGALWRMAKVARALGNEEEAHNACQRLLDEEPCHEAAHRLLMRLYAASGQRAEVVRQFARCKQALREDLAIPPSIKTTTLFTRLVRSLP